MKPFEIEGIVLVYKKTGLPVISTLNDMDWYVGNEYTRSSWHSVILDQNIENTDN